ncbi:MAG: VRR-NUC domain-containing protein [Christensenellales bacterium]
MQHYEENEQIALFRWAAYEKSVYPELEYMFHIPNGGVRNKATGGKLKAAGVKAGVPDICLPLPCKRYAGLYIELKAGKNKPQPNQLRWLDALNRNGYLAVVCYGCEEAIKTIVDYIKLTRQKGEPHE